MARRFVPGLFHLDMSIPLLPLIKPQVLEVGHTTDTRRRITLLSSTLKVAKVSNIHATLTYIRKFTHRLPAVRQCRWAWVEAQIRGVVTH